MIIKQIVTSSVYEDGHIMRTKDKHDYDLIKLVNNKIMLDNMQKNMIEKQ